MTLDLEGIRRSLSKADRADYSIQYVIDWLVECGFRRMDDERWVVREADLGVVEPAEVRTIQVLPQPPPP